MKRHRLADIAFFLGFAGIMYAVLYGHWYPDSFNFKRTIGAMSIGSILVIGSFIYLYKMKQRDKNHDDDGT